MKTLTFTGIIRKEKKGYSSFCTEFEVASCGDSVEDAKENLIEAVELYLENARNLGILKDVLADGGFVPTNGILTPNEYTTQLLAHI